METVEIVKSFVNQLDFTYTITNAVDNLDGTYTLYTCNTYHLQPTFFVTIDGSEYQIEEVVKDTYIIVSGLSLPIVNEFAIYKPFFFSGTAIQTNIELAQLDQFDKMPMVYLLEVLEDRFFNRDEINDRESDLRLFFLTSANFEDWTQKDHKEQAVAPMRSLAYNFIDILNASTGINNIDEYTLIDRVNFGVYITDKGYSQRIFNDNLSGVEMKITLPIKRNLTCKSC